MKTDFKDYLKKKNAQKRIDKLAKKYTGKKILLYGAGFFSNDLMKYYDFSKFDIVAVADMKFQDDIEGNFYGYKKIDPYDIGEINFDVLLIAIYDDVPIRDFLEDEIFDVDGPRCKVETLIKMNIVEYTKMLLDKKNC